MDIKEMVATAATSDAACSASEAAALPINVFITCHDGEVPSYLEAVLEQLYGSLFSSMARFRVYGGAEDASAYVVRINGKITAIFLFRIEKFHVRVLNEGMRVNEVECNRFAHYIFDRFRSVNVITFNAIDDNFQRLDFPFQHRHCSEDSIIELPATADEYLNNFGKSIRRNIKYYLNRLKREFPSFAYCVYDRNQVQPEHIRALVAFNRMRFAQKNKLSSITDEDEINILRMVRECGSVGIVTIDGKICAGSVTYWIGDHCFSWLKSHDPTYNDYRFGMITSYLMIRECISRGAKTFHFLWGRQVQKAQLQGVHHDRSHVTIYRSYAAGVRHTNLMVDNVMTQLTREIRLRLKQREGRNDLVSRAMLMPIHGLRKVRWHLARRGASPTE